MVDELGGVDNLSLNVRSTTQKEQDTDYGGKILYFWSSILRLEVLGKKQVYVTKRVDYRRLQDCSQLLAFSARLYISTMQLLDCL